MTVLVRIKVWGPVTETCQVIYPFWPLQRKELVPGGQGEGCGDF